MLTEIEPLKVRFRAVKGQTTDAATPKVWRGERLPYQLLLREKERAASTVLRTKPNQGH